MEPKSIAAPFPYFGGKRRIAAEVWRRFGAVRCYVEPFAGSLAVLLSVPRDTGRVETVNDANAYLCNFWRAVQADPEAVAHWADWPVNEIDLHARHRWLVVGEGAEEFREAMRADPDHYDAKRAGWWVWGICAWIGGGWCDEHKSLRRPHLGNAGLNRKLPHLGDAGHGLNRKADDRTGYIRDTMQALQERLRDVRVCCGDWKRVTGPSVTHLQGLTAMFLDPPYGGVKSDTLYVEGAEHVSTDAREYALANGDNPRMRIALCGYEEEHAAHMPNTWECFAWKANGGFGNQGRTQTGNKHRERIWFSPHCLRDGGLFDTQGE